MPFKILIVEDEELYAGQLEMLIDKLAYEHLGTVDNGRAAIALIQKEVPDLILMDIHLQGNQDGIALAHAIHKDHSIPIIFITSIQDDATFSRATDANPINFLIKPFNTLQLQRSIELCVNQLNKETPEMASKEWKSDFVFGNYFFIKDRNKIQKVEMKSILYLEADGHYCQIYTENKKFVVRVSMVEVFKKLPPDLFIQSHRSFLINIDKIDAINMEEGIITIGDKKIPISKRNRENVFKRLNWL